MLWPEGSRYAARHFVGGGGSGRCRLCAVDRTGSAAAAPGRNNHQPGRPIQPLPENSLGNPDEVPRRHHPAYSPATIADLVAYVSKLTGGSGPGIPVVKGGDVAAGGSEFRLQCAACHAWAGDGGALLHREAPALHAATPVQIAEAVRVGPGQMPAFGAAALDDRQLASLVSYVRYLRHPEDRGGQPLWHLGPVVEGARRIRSPSGLCWCSSIGSVSGDERRHPASDGRRERRSERRRRLASSLRGLRSGPGGGVSAGWPAPVGRRRSLGVAFAGLAFGFVTWGNHLYRRGRSPVNGTSHRRARRGSRRPSTRTWSAAASRRPDAAGAHARLRRRRPSARCALPHPVAWAPGPAAR